jgi:hypothetical protein
MTFDELDTRSLRYILTRWSGIEFNIREPVKITLDEYGDIGAGLGIFLRLQTGGGS